MADAMNPDPEMEVQTFPVAPRLTHPDRPTPYVGPGIGDYRKAHAQTVGQPSDEWWAKVQSNVLAILPQAHRSLCSAKLNFWPLCV